MKLNTDIGERSGKWTIVNDTDILPLIDQANIACGYDAGDPLTMQNTISLAAKHAVEVNAPVSYPDLQGFGRRAKQLSSQKITFLATDFDTANIWRQLIDLQLKQVLNTIKLRLYT
jgi:UPF0271 protein